MTKLTDKHRVLCKKIGIHDLDKVSLVEFPQQHTLFSPGDACQLFLIVLSGQVRVELTTKHGRVVTLYHIDSGENCLLTTSALLNDERYYTRGITESPVTALAISSQDFHHALNGQTGFAKYVLTGFSSRMASIIGLVDRMATRDVNASLAAFLLDHQRNECIEITQKNLAMEIGTAREVISRKLSEMETQGIIKRGKTPNEKTMIQLLDRQILQEMAG